MTDKELINGCLKNDRSCQKLFFQKFAGKLLLVCRVYARTEAEAEDFVQETFIRAFQKLYTFRFNSSLETWLKTIARNIALKQIQRKSFKNEKIGIPEYLDTSSDNSIIETMSFQEILQYIVSLPHGYRVVFTLNVLENFSHKEIAEQLGIAAITSRSQLLKARKLLQQIIIENQKTPTYE